jgi:hypothetical protein
VAGTKLTPDGNPPDIERVGVGVPVAVTVNVPAVPIEKLVLLALVMLGDRLIVMLKLWVALGSTPFEAVTVPLKVPRTVGVPERTPAGVNVRPVGSTSEVVKVIGVVPVAV